MKTVLRKILRLHVVLYQEQTEGDVSPTRLEKQIDKAVGGWNPSSSQFNAVAGGIRTAGQFQEDYICKTN